MSRFLRKPNVSFVLAGTPEIIRNRKPELEVAEIGRQFTAMSDKLPNICKTIIIDTDDIDEVGVSDEIASFLSEFLRSECLSLDTNS